MYKTTILTVGTDYSLNAAGEWDVVNALNAETAIEKFHQINFDVVVFTNTVQEDAIRLSKLFLFQQPDIILLQYNKEAILDLQIKEALQNKQEVNKPTYSFVDDALQAAGLPIIIQ